MNLLDGADLPSTDTLREEILAKWKDKSKEEILEGKVNADLHAKTLEKEKAEMYSMYKSVYEENQAKAKLQEYIDQLNKPVDNQVANTPANEVKEPPFDPDKFFSEKISSYEKQKKEAENFAKVQSKLKERLGTNYANVLQDRYSELELSNEDMNALAVKSPEAYFRAIGLDDKPQSSFTSPPRSSQRNDSFAPKTVKRDYNYYQELKKTNPMLYLDPKIAVQMEKDAQELGAAFGLPD